MQTIYEVTYQTPSGDMNEKFSERGQALRTARNTSRNGKESHVYELHGYETPNGFDTVSAVHMAMYTNGKRN